MTIARIVCYLSGASAKDEEAQQADRAAATTAIMLGSAFGAGLRFQQVSIDPTRAVPLLGEGMTGAMAARLTEDLETSAKASKEAAVALYQELCGDSGLPTLAEGETPPVGRFSIGLDLDVGAEEEILAERARVADLTVVGQARRGEGETSLVLEALLFDSGRPVLVAPNAGMAEFPKRIAVAWNGSAAASRAIALAMPLLLRAKEVIVISGATDDAPAVTQPSAIAGLLTAHGIETATWRYQPEDWPVSRSLMEEAHKAGAEMIVMGAYGHSRMREMLLGGATREAIKAKDLALFMAH